MLEAEGLAAFRGERWLFRDLSFSLQSGQSLLLQGENGSGKTTLLRILLGFLPPDAGRVLWQKAADTVSLRQNLLYFGHLPALQPLLSVRDNLQFFLQLAQQKTTPAQLDAALAAVGLLPFAEERAARLSAGQKRRVVLARLFCENKALWCLDEPFTALDVAGLALLETQLLRHLDAGGLLIFTSHQLPNAAQLRQRRLLLSA
jgi:heme exporter protein A